MPNNSYTEIRDGQFPNGFIWGAATASYQLEGAANEDGRGESIWDRFSHTPGKVLNGDTGDVACDHYHRYPEDIKLMQQLGLNAYRFSVAWPRILPQGRGRINEAGLDFYDRLVDGLLAANITPWLTLYHWDLPQVLEDQGGWPNRATADAFVEYADVVSRRLGDRVKNWITLNEPWCSSFLSYMIGEHAPGRKNTKDAIAAAHTLLLAHGMAVPVIRANSPDSKVGITLNFSPAYPATESDADKGAAQRWDGFFNRWFIDPVYGRGYPADMVELYGDAAPEIAPGDVETMGPPIDFLGVNYYNPAFVKDDPQNQPLRVGHVRLDEEEHTHMDWVVYPHALYELLLRLGNEYPVRELYITENGAAYEDQLLTEGENGKRVADSGRLRYYLRHLNAAQRAISEGAPLKGYFAWSLMDNFEWAWGYTRRFGIVYVDYETQERVIKDSGRWYSQVIRNNKVVEPSGSILDEA